MIHDPEIKHFNIRIYGLVINEEKEVLLTDEFQLGQKMTKFPGGGLRFGEGPAECMMREAIEEFGQEVEIVEHFYTTDFFQKSFFFKDHQIISIYYVIRFKEPVRFRISEKPFDFPEMKNGSQSFRWKKITGLSPGDLSLPIDQHVAEMLKKRYGSSEI
ncbi:MAG: NUDIX domain-containing protein [Bacteroidales bacterium]|nr:NUDIX domain-containing protein [Bacteroidales bacterium]